ncbi:MAG: hypothetical protein K2X82_02380 [Gemmataceae bacterium]|nr:hypothetical protein [Gemmataceae bacterium]
MSWLSALATLDWAAVAVPLVPQPEVAGQHQTGPPPPFGVDLLHRLHILVC